MMLKCRIFGLVNFCNMFVVVIIVMVVEFCVVWIKVVMKNVSGKSSKGCILLVRLVIFLVMLDWWIVNLNVLLVVVIMMIMFVFIRVCWMCLVICLCFYWLWWIKSKIFVFVVIVKVRFLLFNVFIIVWSWIF